MSELDLSTIKARSLAGIVALTSRTFFLQIVAFAATFLLTILLSPATFGIFYVVSAVISFLTYFSDIGLAAALIQKKDPTEEDFFTTFTIQQLLVISLTIISWFFSGAVTKYYNLDVQGLWLFRALIIAFFLSSLKTIPSIKLERRLEFKKLVIPQIFETLAFYLVAVYLAWRGLGIVSFTWAVLVRSVIGLVIIYLLAPWKPRFVLSLDSAKKLLRFGLPFQANSFLALIKDDLMVVFLGKILPFSQVGYLGWAKKWAEVPLRLFLDSIVRVTFPAFSRLQQNRDLLGKAIEKTVFGLSLLMFPITVGLIFFIKPLVLLIPRYGKWEPAIMAFYLFAVGAAISGLSVPLTNALNAIGKIKITLRLMIFWTSLTWLLSILLINLIGFTGYALALLLITSTVVLVVYLTKKEINFAFMRSVAHPLIGALIQAVWYVGWLRMTPLNLLWLTLVGGSGVILYLGYLWFMQGARLREIYASFKVKNE